MEINKVQKLSEGRVVSMIYSDKIRNSVLFLPKLTLSFFSKERNIILDTVTGDKVYVTEDMLRELNLKLIRNDVGTVGRPNYQQFMSINRPRRAASRIPLLAISKKLNKIYRGRIDVRREYEKRSSKGYGYWEPN